MNEAARPTGSEDHMTGVDLLAIEVAGLTKTFGGRRALDSLALAVTEGTVRALIGPNGSGKTTTVRVLSTLLAPDSGTARVFGHDVLSEPEAVRNMIGVTGQFSAVDKILTGRENLELMADLYHLGRSAAGRRVAELLERFELTDSADRPTMTYSGGMLRRLDLAMTLIGDPRILFLDEPTTGLDPRGRKVLWGLVRDLVADGMTILLTTQYLEEADRFADRVTLIDEGRVVAEGTPAELKQRVSAGRLRLSFADETNFAAAVAVLAGAEANDDTLSLVLPGASDLFAIRRTLDALERHHIAVEGLSAQPPDLDEVFFALTGSTNQREQAAR